VVLDGSLFEKGQGGHTSGHGPHGPATLGYSNRGQRRRRTNTVSPSRGMEPMPQGGDGIDIFIVLVFPVASILPLGGPRLGVSVGAALEAPRGRACCRVLRHSMAVLVCLSSSALEAPRVGALAMVVPAAGNSGPGSQLQQLVQEPHKTKLKVENR
jgi:hypothetical protein